MRISAGLAAVFVLASQAAQAQDSRASPPLPSFPQVYETADLKIRVVKVADGLANPWSLAWLPNGDLLITERAGRLRVFRNGALDPEPIAGVPEVRITALGGLLDVLPHPNFAQNRVLYLTLRERRRGQSRDDGAHARAPRRQDAEGRRGDLRRRELEHLADELRRPHGVRPRRHAVPRRRRAAGAGPRAEHDAARRQGAAPRRERQGAARQSVCG